MPSVQFTSALKRFFPDLKGQQVPAQNVADLIDALEQKYPGLQDYLMDESGALRHHVNVFVDGKTIQDRESLQDQIQENQEVFIFQALSGG